MGWIHIDRMLVLDLEATCWQDRPPEGQANEIIEVGNAMLDLRSGEVTPGPELLVSPIKSKVSPFCTGLTSITQAMIDERGVPFRNALRRLEDRWGDLSVMPWASYGDYDIMMLLDHCRAHGVPYPLSRSHTNVKRLLAMLCGWPKPVGMMQALEKLGIEHSGTHHRGGDDAVNIACLFWEICKKIRV